MLDPAIIATLGQLLVILTLVGAAIGGLVYFYPRSTVGKAQERYVDALEGENAVSRQRIGRLEDDVADLRASLEEALRKVTILESDIATAKRENDRLRAENTSLHDELARR